MKVFRYKLRLIRVEYKTDPYFANSILPVKVEDGPFLQTNGNDVTIRGYAAAITRAGELNTAIKKEGKWGDGWRFVIVQITMEEQRNLFDIEGVDASGI